MDGGGCQRQLQHLHPDDRTSTSRGGRSEIATKLLSQCDFKEGMLAGLPINTKVAHKFGESGTPQEQQLSESAIIYLNDNPYAITIMTKGKDYKQLPQIIKEISNATYQFMQQNAVATN